MMLDAFDQDGGLRVEPLVLGFHRCQLDDQHVRDVVLFVGFEDVVLEVRGARSRTSGCMLSFSM
ncbi:hypothetical protein GO592_32485 [Rhodococcus sp. 21391]|nr:hypothetical protein GO592_32485 [Rhodococcus sp. 21391]